LTGNVLVRLMASPGGQYGVMTPRDLDRVCQRLGSRCNVKYLSIRFLRRNVSFGSLENAFANLRGFLMVRVVVSYYDDVRVFGGDTAHQRSLCSIALTCCTEYFDCTSAVFFRSIHSL